MTDAMHAPSTTRPMARRASLLTAALGAMVLGGCSQFGDPLEAMGARPPAPDEFKIVTREALVVPSSVQGQRAAQLPRPEPGRPTPREPNARANAARALLGPAAGAAVVAPSAGERILVAAAAEGAESDIRNQLEEDEVVAARQAAEGPYEPPTIGELLSFSDEEGPERPDEETLVDPVAESQRLTRGGVRAPSDPTATAADLEEAPPREPIGQPVGTTNRSVQRKTLIVE